MYKKRIVLFLSALALFSVGHAQNQLTPQEQKDGWKLLYDGSSFTGWHTYLSKTVRGSWKSDGGALHVDTNKKSQGDLLTNDEYENFDLKLQWKIAPAGNSGILFPVKEMKQYDGTYVTGMEMQVLDNDGHEDGKILKHRAGDLYDLIKSSSEPVKKVGEWNDVEIKLVGGKLDFYLNGVHIVSTVVGDAHWKTLVQGSKFKKMPGFAKYKTGRIALQDHGCDVWYRDIRIHKL